MARRTYSLPGDVELLIKEYGLVLVVEAMAKCAEEHAETELREWWTLAARLLAGLAKGLRETL